MDANLQIKLYEVGATWKDWHGKDGGPTARLPTVVEFARDHAHVFLGFFGLVFPSEGAAFEFTKEAWMAVRAEEVSACRNAIYWLSYFDLSAAIACFHKACIAYAPGFEEHLEAMLSSLAVAGDQPSVDDALRAAHAIGALAVRSSSKLLPFYGRQWARKAGIQSAVNVLSAALRLDRARGVGMEGAVRLIVGCALGGQGDVDELHADLVKRGANLEPALTVLASEPALLSRVKREDT